MQKFNVNGQSVPKIDWKQTDGRTKESALSAALTQNYQSLAVIHSTGISQSRMQSGRGANNKTRMWVVAASPSYTDECG